MYLSIWVLVDSVCLVNTPSVATSLVNFLTASPAIPAGAILKALRLLVLPVIILTTPSKLSVKAVSNFVSSSSIGPSLVRLIPSCHKKLALVPGVVEAVNIVSRNKDFTVLTVESPNKEPPYCSTVDSLSASTFNMLSPSL